MVRTASRRMIAGSTRTKALIGLAALSASCSQSTGPDTPPVDLGTLALGEAKILRNADKVDEFQFIGGAEYAIAVQSASRTPEAAASMLLTVEGDAAAANPSRASQAAAGRPPVQARPSVPPLRDPRVDDETHLRLHRRAREELRRSGATPFRGGRRPAGVTVASLSAADVPPPVGDVRIFNIAVLPGLEVDCMSTQTATGEAKLVGTNFVFYEDQRVAGNFMPADYAKLAAELDARVFPINTEYWGSPADIDGNQRVIVFFTPEVNGLVPPGSGAIVDGFIFFGDLGNPQSCQVSNVAEILYVLAPDPGGQFGDPIDAAEAIASARRVVAHEFQHLLSAQQRLPPIGNGTFDDLDDLWLLEAAAHVAEEVAGLAAAGLGTRANITLAEAIPDQNGLDAFNDFHLANYARLRDYMEDPENTLALGTTDGRDPIGVESLKMRGFGYLFLRWVADQFAPAAPVGTVPGSGEHLFFREISTGGGSLMTGTDNVLRAIQTVGGATPTWDELVAQYSSVPPATDAAPGSAPGFTQLATWDLRDVYLGLHNNAGSGSSFPDEYPLAETAVAFSPGSNQNSGAFDVLASTARYFRLTGSATTPVRLRLTSPNGSRLPDGARPQVTIVRIR